MLINPVLLNSKTIFDKFAKYHPELSKHVVNYRMGGPYEIILYFDNRPEMIYNYETCKLCWDF